MQSIHHPFYNSSPSWEQTIPQPSDSQTIPKEIYCAGEEFRLAMQKIGITDSNGEIVASKILEASLPALSSNQQSKLQSLLKHSFIVNGRIPAHPIGLTIAIHDIIEPFYHDHEIFLAGSKVWNLLGEEYFENYFHEVFKVYKGTLPLFPFLSPLLKEKTSRESDVDIIIMIDEISEMEKFFQILNHAHTKLYDYEELYYYLYNKQQFLIENSNHSNYSFQVLAHVNLNQMSYEDLKQLLLELNCFEKAKNIKENALEIYIRSMQAADGTKYDFTFVVNSPSYAYTFQGLNIPLKSYDRLIDHKPCSFHANAHQVIFDVNSGITRLRKGIHFSERELALFFTAQTRGNIYIDEDTERIISSYLENQITKDNFASSLLNLIFQTQEKHHNDSLDAAFCLFFNTCTFLTKISEEYKAAIEQLKQLFMERFKRSEKNCLLWATLLDISTSFENAECFFKIWSLFLLTQNNLTAGFKAHYIESESSCHLQLALCSDDEKIKSYINFEAASFNFTSLLHLKSEQLELFLNFLAERRPRFTYGAQPALKKDAIFPKIFSVFEALEPLNAQQKEMEIYLLLINLTGQPTKKYLDRLICRLFDDSLSLIPKQRLPQIIRMLLDFFQFLPSKNQNFLEQLLEQVSQGASDLSMIKVLFWGHLPISFPPLDEQTSYFAYYSIFSNSLSLPAKKKSYELTKNFPENVCTQLAQTFTNENDPQLFSVQLLFFLKTLVKFSQTELLILSYLKQLIESYDSRIHLIENREILKELFLKYLEKNNPLFFSNELIEITKFFLFGNIIKISDLKEELRLIYYDQISENFFHSLQEENNILTCINRLTAFFKISNHKAFKKRKAEAFLHFFNLGHQFPNKLVNSFQTTLENLAENLASTFEKEELQSFLFQLFLKLEKDNFFEVSHPTFYIELIIKLFTLQNSIHPDLMLSLIARTIEMIEAGHLLDWSVLETFLLKEQTLSLKDKSYVYYLYMLYKRVDRIDFSLLEESISVHLAKENKIFFFSNFLNYFETLVESQIKSQKFPSSLLKLADYFKKEKDLIKAVYYYKKACSRDLDEKEYVYLQHMIFQIMKNDFSLGLNFAIFFDCTVKIKKEGSLHSLLLEALNHNEIEIFVCLSTLFKNQLTDQNYLTKIEKFFMEAIKNFQQDDSLLNLTIQYFENFTFVDSSNLSKLFYQIENNKTKNFSVSLEKLLYCHREVLCANPEIGKSCLLSVFKYIKTKNNFALWIKLLETAVLNLLRPLFQSETFACELCQLLLDSLLENFRKDPQKASLMCPYIYLLPPILFEKIYWSPKLSLTLAELFFSCSDAVYFLKGARVIDDLGDLRKLSKQDTNLLFHCLNLYVKGFHKFKITISESNLKLISKTILIPLQLAKISPRDCLNFMIQFAKFLHLNPSSSPCLNLFCEELFIYILASTKKLKLSEKDRKAFRLLLNYLDRNDIFCKGCLKIEDHIRWLGNSEPKPCENIEDHKENRLDTKNKSLAERITDLWIHTLHVINPRNQHPHIWTWKGLTERALTMIFLSLLAHYYGNFKKTD